MKYWGKSPQSPQWVGAQMCRPIITIERQRIYVSEEVKKWPLDGPSCVLLPSTKVPRCVWTWIKGNQEQIQYCCQRLFKDESCRKTRTSENMKILEGANALVPTYIFIFFLRFIPRVPFSRWPPWIENNKRWCLGTLNQKCETLWVWQELRF